MLLDVNCFVGVKVGGLINALNSMMSFHTICMYMFKITAHYIFGTFSLPFWLVLGTFSLLFLLVQWNVCDISFSSMSGDLIP